MSEIAPITANRTLRRLSNAAYRPREYLTEAEVDRLIEASRKRGATAQGMLQRSCSRIDMAFALPSCVSFAGRKLISSKGACMSIGPKVALKAFIPCMGQSSER